MRLSELEQLDSFALLGPGFGGRRFLLLADLHRATAADCGPCLAYAPFETAGRNAHLLAAATRRTCDPVFDVAPADIAVSLQAEGHREAVERIRAAIARGDVYQVCYTVRATVHGASGAQLLARMTQADVPRFAAWVRLPWGEEFVSASAELFFEVSGRHIHTEPMKGTAARSAAADLQASDKDRAELAMITDLLRNDLATVCRPRSVAVPCARRIVRLAYAVQTVSDVTGELREGETPLGALAALHPGGSVTGAPKQAALAMIRALEGGPRGAYCGALGLWHGEQATFSLLIRTAARRGEAWAYGVGGGIVYDSDPDAELAEVRVKLGALQGAGPT
ncbi:MAG: chorismate-binding protein [Candidatus Latescibacterota bacterium]